MTTRARAKELARKGRLQAHWIKRKDGTVDRGKAAMVYSITSRTAYLVQKLQGTWVCTCPYKGYSGDPLCKHVQAVIDKAGREGV